MYENDSEEEIPLRSLVMKDEPRFSHSIPYGELCRKEVVHCEFCEKIFLSRYRAITHNASHIIIPLLKQSLKQCEICLYYFTSDEKFNTHTNSKHPEQVRQKTNNIINKLVFEDDSFSGDDTNGDTENILRPFADDCKVKIDTSDDYRVINKNDSHEPAKENGLDHENDSEFQSYDCIVYDKLIKPGFFKCKHCTKIFPNRYEALRHNTVHLKIKKSIYHLCCHCEKFFERTRTLATHVWLAHRRKFEPHVHKKCKRCRLPYHSTNEHIKLYHPLVCQYCDGRYGSHEFHDHVRRHTQKVPCPLCGLMITEYDLREHITVHSVVMKICDFCEQHSKDSPMFHYRHLQKCELGENVACDQCTLMCTSLNIVQKVFKVNGAIGDGKVTVRRRNNAKRITNEVRLRNIQNRLKSLKRY